MTEQELDAIILKDIHAAVDLVRGNQSDDPIVWLTGNNYMPPLRAWGSAETVWQSDDFDAWEEYAERWERGLENHNIYVGCPEWDNALYAVDLSRWEYSDNEEGEDLQSEWVRRSVDA